ncbi:MAG: alpha/beta fold hydrolase [Bacteroidia bacterium]|nr:alpha/beta fold hydrolase [Bacteroidia bacterium]
MKLHVQRLGKGHPFIILHGLYGSGDNWLTIARSLSGLCEVFLVDQRNHGRSPHSDHHNYETLAADLLEMMDDYGLSNGVILGHSMGGKAAMWFAARHPSRVSRLIIADISPRSYLDNALDHSHSAFHSMVIGSMLSVDFTNVTGLGDIDRQLENRLPDKQLRQFLLKNIEKEPGSGYVWRLNLPALLRNLDNLSEGLESFLAEGKIFNQFPVLFIRGENSGYIRETDIVMIRQLFPNAQIETIKNAGHWLHTEQPAVFAAVIKRELLG